MSTTLSQFRTQFSAAQASYQSTLTSFINAMIDVEALAITIERIGGGQQPHIGTWSMSHWQDLTAILEHPLAAPRKTNFASVTGSGRIKDRVDGAAATYTASWSGT